MASNDDRGAEGISRRRTFTEVFYGLVFDESQLKGLAATVKRLTTDLAGASVEPSIMDTPISISIDSQDGETFEIRERLELLANAELPQAIRRVTVYSRVLDASTRLSLSPSYATLEGDGKNGVQTRALFIQMKEEIDRHKYDYSWIAKWIRHGVSIPITYLLFFLVLLLLIAPPWTWEWAKVRVLVLLLYIILFVSLLIAFVFHTLLKKAFPSVRFEGHFFDSSRRVRSVLKWCLSAVVVPILLRVFYELWTKNKV
jgi:hypothetical protein